MLCHIVMCFVIFIYALTLVVNLLELDDAVIALSVGNEQMLGHLYP
jgi:hypothetical protein